MDSLPGFFSSSYEDAWFFFFFPSSFLSLVSVFSFLFLPSLGNDISCMESNQEMRSLLLLYSQSKQRNKERKKKTGGEAFGKRHEINLFRLSFLSSSLFLMPLYTQFTLFFGSFRFNSSEPIDQNSFLSAAILSAAALLLDFIFEQRIKGSWHRISGENGRERKRERVHEATRTTTTTDSTQRTCSKYWLKFFLF